MQPLRICMEWSKVFEETFENTPWRKVKQMRPMWLCTVKKSQTQPVCKLWTVEIVRPDSISSFCLFPALHMFVNRKFAKKNRQTFRKTGINRRKNECRQDLPEMCPILSEISWGRYFPKWRVPGFICEKKLLLEGEIILKVSPLWLPLKCLSANER